MERKRDRPQGESGEQGGCESQYGDKGNNGSQDERRNERRFGWSDFEER